MSEQDEMTETSIESALTKNMHSTLYEYIAIYLYILNK
jgi:hypothetical protein